MGQSTCVACGECVQACPTGALAPAKEAYLAPTDRTVSSLCPYCGVGCQLTYHVKDNEIVRVEGRDGPANHDRLCVKGRFGFDYVHHPQRLTRPLIRKPGVAKDPKGAMDPANPLEAFREASWEEALALAGGTLREDPRRTRAERAGGLRVGQGQQRGGLPVPEAGAHRLRHQQRRPLHAAVPCVQRRGAARRHWLRRRVEPGDGRAAGRRRAPHRRQPGRQPSGGGHVDQERGQERHEADPRRPAPLGTCPARRALPAVQARYRRRDAQRDDAHDRRGGPGRAELHRRPHAGLRGTESQRGRIQSRGDGAGLRHPGGDDPRSGAAVRDVEGLDDPVGHGHLAARPRHRQRALPDRADDDDRPGRPSRHGTASAARPEQRAGRVRRRPHPDDASRLPARRQRCGQDEIRGAVGPDAGSEAGSHRRRDHGCGARREDPRHVHHGREPGDVRSGCRACAPGVVRARDAGRAGHLPDRDRLSRRCDSSGVGVSGKDRNLHQHRPLRAARAAGARAAG